MGRMLAVICALAGPVQAQDWASVTDVAALLSGRTVDYAQAWQRFSPSGKTLYHAGRPDWGDWTGQGARYCSRWAPGWEWSCYDMQVAGDQVRFIDDRGGVTEGVLRP